jgi:hypothetical protein
MSARLVDLKETVVDFSYEVAVALPRSLAGKTIPWMLGKKQSQRTQYDDAIMEYWSFRRGPVNYWLRSDEPKGEFTMKADRHFLIFKFSDEDTAFLFKMRFV